MKGKKIKDYNSGRKKDKSKIVVEHKLKIGGEEMGDEDVEKLDLKIKKAKELKELLTEVHTLIQSLGSTTINNYSN